MITSGLLPVLFAVAFHYGEKNTSFGALSYKTRQIIIGMAFGILAVLSTEFSIDIGGAGLNVRDAAPLTAGLLFGGPAGIIAGLMGGVERWFASLWGVGEYTRLACTLATGIAGFLAAAVRRYAALEGYYIISVLPVDEAVFSRQVAVYVLIFMEVLVFSSLFAYIYFLIKKLVLMRQQHELT